MFGERVITDTIRFGGLSISNLTFGEATTYSPWLGQLPVGGTIVIDRILDGVTNLTTFTTQLNSSAAVEKALVTLSFVISEVTLHSNGNKTTTSKGQLTVEAEDEDSCVPGSYVYSPYAGPVGPGFRVDSVESMSISGYALSLTVNPNRSTAIVDYYPGIFGSMELIQLLVGASGLAYTGSDNYYELGSCDDMQRVQDVTLNLAGGAKVTITAADYIYRSVSGSMCNSMAVNRNL